MSRMYSSFSLVVLLILFVAGCAAPQKKVVEEQRFFWPPKPEEPRVEFIGVYATKQDFGVSAQAAVDAFLGVSPEQVLQGPYGITGDDEGRVFVSDVYGKNIQVFDFNTQTISPLLKESFLERPYGITLDAAKNLYVLDADLQKVFVMSLSGKVLSHYADKDRLVKPAYMAINERLQRLYVSDVERHKIVVFDMNSREVLFDFGGQGKNDGQLFSPQGMAIDKQDNVYVADMLNARVQVFDKDGNFKDKWGERGDDEYSLDFPKDLAFDSDENLWLVDARRPYFRIFRKDGRLLAFIGGARRTHNPVTLSYPVSLYITPTSKVFITDFLNQRFAWWQYLTKEYLQLNPIGKR